MMRYKIMPVLVMNARTIVYCQKGQLFTSYKPDMHGCFGMFENYNLPTFYWVVKVYSHHVELIVDKPVYIEDAFRIIDEYGRVNGKVRETHSMMFDDLDNLPF